jgi:hypothetical protein
MRIMVSAGGPYLGLLTQSCTRCNWNDTSLRNEVEACPKCGAPAGKPSVLRFGGLTVEYGPGNKFHMSSQFCRERVQIDEADVPSTIRFLARHFEDWSGTIRVFDASEHRRAALAADLLNALEYGVEALAQGYGSEASGAFTEVEGKLEKQARGLFAEVGRTQALAHVKEAERLRRDCPAEAVACVARAWKLLTAEAARGVNPFAALAEEKQAKAQRAQEAKVQELPLFNGAAEEGGGR